MQSKQHFHLRDIILLALIGIIFAVIYFGADFIYNALTVALSPIGYGPAATKWLPIAQTWCRFPW